MVPWFLDDLDVKKNGFLLDLNGVIQIDLLELDIPCK